MAAENLGPMPLVLPINPLITNIFEILFHKKFQHTFLHRIQSIFGHPAVVSDDSSQSARHTLCETAEIVGRHLSDPHLLDLGDHVCLVGRPVLGKLILHDVPGILDGVEVW